MAARQAGATIMTKDEDFVYLLEEMGSPPQIIWLTCGNTSNAELKRILNEAGNRTLSLLASAEPLVEIEGK